MKLSRINEFSYAAQFHDASLNIMFLTLSKYGNFRSSVRLILFCSGGVQVIKSVTLAHSYLSLTFELRGAVRRPA